MYVIQRDACTVPNSATPVSATQIAAGQAALDQMAAIWNNANRAFGNLIARPDLNAAGMPIVSSPSTGAVPAVVDPKTGAAVPSSGAPALPPAIRAFDEYPVPSGAAAETRLETWPSMCIGNGRPVVVPTPQGCQALIPEAPPMPKLTIGPVGRSYTPDRPVPSQGPNLLWALALGAGMFWLIKEAR